MQRYDIILVDADDTLLDFRLAERTAIKKTLTDFELPCGNDIISAYSEINKNCWKRLERREIDKETLKILRFKELCQRFSFDNDPREIAKAYHDNLCVQSFTIDGAVEFCKRLSKKCEVYIVTNGIKSIQIGRMKNTGLLPYVKNVFISEDIGYEKPDIRYFEKVADLIPNFNKSRALIIGDSLTSDIKGGINFGIDTCWYNINGAIGEGMTYVARSFCEIEEIIYGRGENNV